MSEHNKNLEMAAPLLNGLRRDENSRVAYDLLAGGLSWSDEVPPFSIENVGKSFRVLRPLIRFRSSLIAGNPDERFSSLWDEAMTIMPNWPGFAADRRDVKWFSLLKELEAKLTAEFDELDAKLAAGRQTADSI